MIFLTYKKLIKQIQLGKQLPDAVYLHESALEVVPEILLFFLKKIIKDEKLEKVTCSPLTGMA